VRNTSTDANANANANTDANAVCVFIRNTDNMHVCCWREALRGDDGVLIGVLQKRLRLVRRSVH
jgi:hypothetical protein